MSVADLCASAWAIAALRVAAESDLLVAMSKGTSNPTTLAAASQIHEPVLLSILEVLEANGFVTGSGKDKSRAFILTAEGTEIANRIDHLRADLAVTLGQTNAFVVESRRSNLAGGWQHTDGEVIRAQSMLSELLTGAMLDKVVAVIPELDRLARPGAKFIDVGAGGAGVSISFCRRFPSLHGVALDPLRAARLEAATKIKANGLADRIELRSGRLEQLADENVYDVAFVAAPFLPDAALVEGLPRLKAALQPGGIVLFGAYQPPTEPRSAAASKLRWQLWSGARSSVDLARTAEAAGFEVAVVPQIGNMVPIIARRK